MACRGPDLGDPGQSGTSLAPSPSLPPHVASSHHPLPPRVLASSSTPFSCLLVAWMSSALPQVNAVRAARPAREELHTRTAGQAFGSDTTRKGVQTRSAHDVEVIKDRAGGRRRCLVDGEEPCPSVGNAKVVGGQAPRCHRGFVTCCAGGAAHAEAEHFGRRPRRRGSGTFRQSAMDHLTECAISIL